MSEKLRSKGISISECSLNEEENRIYLYVENLDEQMIKAVKNTFNSDAIVIKGSNGSVQPCYNTNVAGKFVYFSNGSGSYIGAGTFTFGTKDSNDNLGIVTFGHELKVGYSTGYGTVTKVAFGGSSDAAFIKITDGDTPTARISFDTAARLTNVVFSTMPQGTSVVVARGTTQSYAWGTVNSTSASALVGTTWISDMYTTNISLQQGDSGSPLLYPSDTVQYGYGLLGQTSGVNVITGNSYFVKFTNVYSGLGLTSYIIEP